LYIFVIIAREEISRAREEKKMRGRKKWKKLIEQGIIIMKDNEV